MTGSLKHSETGLQAIRDNLPDRFEFGILKSYVHRSFYRIIILQNVLQWDVANLVEDCYFLEVRLGSTFYKDCSLEEGQGYTSSLLQQDPNPVLHSDSRCRPGITLN